MKAYKSALLFIFALITFSNAFAFDCVNEQDFVIPEAHWIHKLSPEIQYYTVLYLSEKTVEQCLEEKPSEKTKKLRLELEKTIGTDKLSELERKFVFLFDTRSAFETLGLDIMDDDFLQKLRYHKFSKE
ncbi:TPA: hypothetical protein NJ360_004490 [Vibrio parahaemolyticus]|uniref:hypothetical protein n=1 Tax=Vibrio parahaemolyticus TaxID=670 RepID=UPI000A36CDF7|nr:hypothetical protein [Vibrio parahaemolyticus]MDF4706527.1 hypothetical protein [Vibrio parahaemolyticus]OUD49020.1 hypothetical protein BTA15_23750 [Vibrio parahaemolyticus]HCE2223099.1 hypothetical protein [Vibrio parahaemolyticus]HCG7236554.1 hypothetical protein [Vibrio parahaemolyticus]